MQARVILAIALLTTAPLVALPTADAATGYRLVAFGDDGTTGNTQANVNGAVGDGALGYVGLGDYYYWSSPSQWKSMFSPLTSKGAYLALGNHDDYAAMADVMGPTPTWSKSVGGARIVSINTEARMDVGSSQYDQVRGALCNAPEATRVLVLHKGWWLQSGAHHLGSEFPGSASAMDQMVQDCGVDLVLAGHEHNYQRMMRNGVPYLIVGTGGQSLYGVAGSPSGTVASCSCYGRVVLDLSSTGIAAQFKALDGSVKDSFTKASGSTTTPPPTPTPTPTVPGAYAFQPTAGNNWWVQVKVTGGMPAGVDARVNGGAWHPLTLRSWGDWAASFYVPSGAKVQFQAREAATATASACWRWTDRAPIDCGATATPAPTYAATFTNARGNAWWVETDVSGANLAGVDARVNGGAWVALSKTSWGSWAKGLSAPAGSTVQFRARDAAGSSALSPTYAWPP